MVGAAAVALAAGSAAWPAAAAERAPAPASFTVTSFPAVGNESLPDDITRLGAHIYVAFQNGVGPMGEASPSGVTASTVQQYSLSGVPQASWTVVGKIDGIGADEAHQRLLLTTNEDGNSSFHTLTPTAGQSVHDYAYVGLTHGGGTDAISVTNGKILISGSHPATTTGAATYQVTLQGNTANLTPVLSDNSQATAVNGPQAGHTVSLALTDPDSTLVVPADAARFANTYMLDGQADKQLVFASHAGTPRQHLQVLNLAQSVNDTVFASGHSQTLWVTDPTANTVDAVTGPFQSGQAISAVTPTGASNWLGSLNLNTGALTPISQLAAIHPSGLLFTSSGNGIGNGHSDNGDGNGNGNGRGDNR
jgi:hypothetical protein